VEHGPDGGPALFQDAAEVIVARTAPDVAPALRRAEAARAAGGWIAGYLAYEAGYALEPRLSRLMPGGQEAPLLALGVFDGPVAAEAVLAQAVDEGRA
ncbi:MAG: aminodeoxychorismate synthase component I, partial [Pseudomonadota bacterium]